MKKIFSFFHYLLIPQAKNNFRAKALHHDFLTIYLLVALVSAIMFKNTVTVGGNVLGFATDVTIEKLFQLTNAERTKQGLSPLTYNDQLATAGQRKAADMFAKNYWAHYAPDGTAPWDFIKKAGYTYEYAGENLAKNFMFSQGVVDAWMNSTTHRENLLRKEYTDVGFAVVNGVLNGEETTLVVQEFGKPLSGLALTREVSAQEPQPVISQAPQAVPTTAAAQSEVTQTIPTGQTVNGLSGGASRPLINLMPAYVNLNLVFFAFLLLALLLDLYFAMKLKVIRVGGKNIAHFMFIGFIFAGLLLITLKGAIL